MWWVIIGGLVAYLITPLDLGDRKTYFYKYCGDLESTTDACKEQILIGKREYKISFPAQVVVSKNTLYNLTDCIVFDKENWRCKTELSGSNVRMSNGFLYNDSERNALDENGRETPLSIYEGISGISYNIRAILRFFK